MFGPHFNLVFFGGGGGVSWVNRALEGSILKLNIQHALFLTFLSKIAAGYLQALPRIWTQNDREQIQQAVTASFELPASELQAQRFKTPLTTRPHCGFDSAPS